MPRRGKTAERGYNWAYRKARAQILGPSGNGTLDCDPVCHWQLPGCTRVATTADHEPPLDVAKVWHLNLVPSCKHCNSVKGNTQKRRPTTLGNPVPGW